MNLLEVRQVKKQFGSNVVLNNLTFSIPQGSIFGFVGKNGAGKTTLLRSITDNIGTGTTSAVGEGRV